jgi:hypothetical protein
MPGVDPWHLVLSSSRGVSVKARQDRVVMVGLHCGNKCVTAWFRGRRQGTALFTCLPNGSCIAKAELISAVRRDIALVDDGQNGTRNEVPCGCQMKWKGITGCMFR